MTKLHDDFIKTIDPHWAQLCTGGGSLQVSNSILRMKFDSAQDGIYTDAQIDDQHTKLMKPDFPWRAPLRMTVRARSSHPAATAESTKDSKGILRGTAGFGFWNKPVVLERDLITLPDAIWFFYASPPSNMALVPNTPGWGWKAQVVHSMRLGAVANAVPLSVAALYGRVTGDVKPASRWMQRMTGTTEAILSDDMTKWHTYVLEWRKDMATFWVDGKLVLKKRVSITRPLAFIAWIDNAYAIATPRGELKFGAIETGSQWFEMDSVKIEPL